MKTLIQSLIVAFAMYSKVPMPKVEWSEKNMRYALCFFPLVGLLIGLLLYVWFCIGIRLGLNDIMLSTIATLIPLLLTGAIHMDGFCDTVDAMSSHASIEEKQRILKDPHVGTFAVLGAIGYVLLMFALWTQYNFTSITIIIICIGFLCSRIFSALSLVLFKLAKKDGTAATFSIMSKKNTLIVALLVELFLCIGVMLYLNCFLALAILLAILLTYYYYKCLSSKDFGGINGDLAGFFLQLCEMVVLLVVVIYQIYVIQ